jgi:ABC-type multidrug transport system fused ATPase/permease subunit
MQSIIYYMKQLHQHSGMKLYINIIGMVINSLLESVGLLLLIPMLGLSGIIAFNQGTGTHFRIFDELRRLPPTTALSLTLGLYLIIVFGQNIITKMITIRNTEIQQNFSRQLRYDTYRVLLRTQWTYFLNKRTSDLVNLLTIELARVMAGINLFLTFITSLLFTVIQIGVAFWLSPGMTAIVLCCGGILALLSRGYIRKSKALGSRTSQLAQSYLAGISDQLHGMKDIKSNNLEHSWLDWLQTLTYGVMQEQLDYIRLRMNSQLLYKLSSAVLIACFVFVSYQFLHTEGQYVLIVILIFARLWPRFTGLQTNLEQMAASIPAFHALKQLNGECTSWAEQGFLDDDNRELHPLRLTQGLECRDLNFRYHSHLTSYALQHMNLTIPANRMTAIVGKSGAGKSTLIDVIMGLMSPESGQLLLDGEPITSDNLFSYRRSIGYVAQDPFLYNASIRENLMMIEPNATEEQLWQALEFASSDDFVRKLPQGLDTLIGDRGIRLSGGERQRIVLARAIIRKPSILVLDEATSALDTENEKKIQEALHRLKGTMTIIVVAHRLSTIRHADQIIVIEDGKLAERGTYTELVSVKDGEFSKLVSNQEAAV